VVLTNRSAPSDAAVIDGSATGTAADNVTYIKAGSKAVSVGTQSGTLTTGTAGTVTFLAATANIATGSAIALNNLNAVTGIGLVTTVTTGNDTVVTIKTTTATPAGNHPLTLTIDGATSPNFTLTVTTVEAPNPSNGDGGGGGGGGCDAGLGAAALSAMAALLGLSAARGKR
jgi:hypothetical protein